MVKVVATIEARMRSSRLPGKVLMPLAGAPALARMVERVRRARLLSDVVVATTVHPQDEPIVAAMSGTACFRGSEEDVLDRVLKAAESAGADLIVELTGDCPLADPELIDRAIEQYRRGGFDYVSNVVERTFPRGLDTQVFSVETLRDVARRTQDAADHEHVSLYIYEHPELYRLGHFHAEPELRRPELRWTVDTPADYELMRRIYEELYPKQPAFRSADVVRLLERRPELAAMNREISQKAVRP